jgi:hypothetical protein
MGAREEAAPEEGACGAELTARAATRSELGALERPVVGLCRCMETELGAVSVCIGKMIVVRVLVGFTVELAWVFAECEQSPSFGGGAGLDGPMVDGCGLGGVARANI